MGTRASISVPNFSHGTQPIPAASRVGKLIVTGGIGGLDPETGAVPDDLKQQCANMFENLRRIIEAAGGSLSCIAKVTVWVKSPEARAVINSEWTKLFPDEKSRPARHTLTYDHLPKNMLLQCDALAFLD